MTENLDLFQREALKKKMYDRHNQRSISRKDRHLGDIREILKTAQGRRLAYEIMDKSGVHAETFVPGAQDQSTYNQGAAAIGRDLLNDILEASMESFFQMQREKASERAQDKAEDARIIQEVETNG